MSLQVWLPLMGDIHNQGLADITTTNIDATTDTNGKIGACYYFNGTSARIACSSQTWAYPLSICGWFKPTDVTNTTTQYWISYNTATGGTAGHAIAIGTYSGKLGIWYGGTQYYSFTQTLSNNVWYHIAVTITSDKQVTTYLNGTQIDTRTFSSNNPGSSWLTLGARSNSTTGGVGAASYYYKGYMNDARLYDHCLSASEVKKLAKGLVLHYPLNNNGWGNENILTNSTGHQGTTGWSGLVTASAENGNPYLIAKRTDTTTTSRTFCTHSAITSLISSWAPGDSFTLSGYYKVPSTEAYEVTGNMFIRWTHTTSASTYTDTGFSTASNVEKDKWIYFSYTYNVPVNYQNGNVNFYLSAFSQGLSTIYWKNVKLEFGSEATPWCPAPSDTLYTTLNIGGTTEYDISGYCKNGLRINTMSYTSDTPKYGVSTNFNGTTDGILIQNLQLSNIINTAITYSFWIKPNGESGARSVYFGSYSGNSWSIEKTTGNVLRSYWNGSPDETCTGATITDNVWQHVCIVKDGISSIKVYINGVQKWASTATHNNITFPETFRIGRDTRSNDGTPYKGLMSDFRIYATALSAEDVAELYAQNHLS